MKKTILVSVAIFLTTLFNHSFAKNPDPGSKKKDKTAVIALIIDANVKVVLVPGDNTDVRTEGDDFFSSQVMIKRKKNTIIINSKYNYDLKKRGVIYISAVNLDYIRINHDASVESKSTLHAPKIDVVVNGECNVAIVTTGEVNLIETDAYTYVQTVRKINKASGTKKE